MGVDGVETVEVGTVKPPDGGLEAVEGLNGGTEPSAEEGAAAALLPPPGLKGSSSASLWYEPLGDDG